MIYAFLKSTKSEYFVLRFLSMMIFIILDEPNYLLVIMFPWKYNLPNDQRKTKLVETKTIIKRDFNYTVSNKFNVY